MNYLLAPIIEFKADESQAGLFEGYGSTFGNVDLGKDVCKQGCFKRSLKELGESGQLPAMYWMHDKKLPIGDWLHVQEDAKGLKVRGQLWLGKGIPEAERAALMLKGTGPKGMSIGYVTKKSSYDDRKGIRTLEDVDLPEISIVGYGMNPKALVTAIKSHLCDGHLPTARDVEELLRDAGFSERQAKALISEGYKALKRDASVDELKNVSDAYLRKIAKIVRS